MSVERIIVETNDETGNNPVEYDWEFDPDGVFRMTGDGDMPAAFEESAAIVDAFNHVNMSIINYRDDEHRGLSLPGSENGANRWLTPPTFVPFPRDWWRNILG